MYGPIELFGDLVNGLKAMPHDNDLRDGATSTMEFNDCNDIVEG